MLGYQVTILASWYCQTDPLVRVALEQEAEEDPRDVLLSDWTWNRKDSERHYVSVDRNWTFWIVYDLFHPERFFFKYF